MKVTVSNMTTTDLSPTNQRCEYLTNSLGIDVRQPRLFWTLQAEQRGRRQSAYQILVSSSEDRLRSGDGDLWDSGKVASSQSTHVIYQGASLASGQRAWWTVRVWDEEDNASQYSDPAWWEMGLLQPEDWQGAWIARDVDESDSTELPPSPYLRTTFTLSRPVRRARLYITARPLRSAAEWAPRGRRSARTRLDRLHETHPVSDLRRRRPAPGRR